MSFISRISRALGFGSDNSEDFLDENEEIAAGTEAPSAISIEERAAGLIEVPTLPEIDPDMKSRIFEGVVEIFNKSLPDFIARSVDPAAQRRLLLEALDKSTDDYLNSLMALAEQYAEKKLQAAVETSSMEAEKLRNEMAQFEQQRASLRESQLSADRRRRALSDRVNDLEGKLATVEAEREQFELENKSLINKLKVADVQPGVIDELNATIDSLRAQLAAAGTATQTVPDPEAEKRVEELNQAIADLRTQQEMSQTMYNDLQEKFNSEREARAAAESKLAEAEKNLAEFDKFSEQLGEVETLIQKRDERIEKLKNANRRLREDNEQLRRRIEENDSSLFAPAPGAEAPAPLTEKNAGEQPGETASDIFNEMADLENDFECPSWFVAEPGPGPVPLHDDSAFGYQEPPRKPRKPDSDAQLSLF